MAKTASIPDDAHALIVEKQREIKAKHKISVNISDIIDIMVKKNIHKLTEYLGIKESNDGSDGSEVMVQNSSKTKDNIKE